MKLTPLDIQQMKFPHRLRGYDREEVDRFLEVVTKEYEEVLKDNQSLKDRIGKLEAQAAETRKKEETISRTMLTAQGVVSDLKSNAQREAELIVKDAELQAETMIRAAHAHVANLEKELLELRKQRLVAVDKMRGVMRVFQTVLDIEEDEGLRDLNPNGMSQDRSKPSSFTRAD